MSNVLCFALMDNGGQMINLTRALNRHTDHHARCITVNISYLDYDTDILLGKSMDLLRLYELRDMISKTDFFIFSETLPTTPSMRSLLENLGIYKRSTPANTIIRTAGSIARSRCEEYRSAWVDDGWTFAGPVSDWSLSGQIGRMAAVNYICPVDAMPTCVYPDPNDKIRVCFSPTKKKKGTDVFNRVMDKITSKHPNIEKVLISGMSFKESLQLKSTCHITFDQFMLHHYANSAIESMYLCHAVLSDVGPWCRMIHPGLPIINVKNENELHDSLIDVIENKEFDWIGSEGKRYVLEHHHPEVVAKQWNYLIEHVQSM